MADLRTRVEMSLAADERLRSGVSAAIEHVAQRREMELGPRAALVAAVEEACGSTFTLLADDQAEIQVVVEDFADRVQVVIEYAGEPLPSIGLETFAQLGEQKAGSRQPVGLMLLTLVDRVSYETVNGRQRMTLIKHLQPAE